MCDDMTELDDAIIEDTVHCTVCGAPFVLGDNDPYVIIEPPDPLRIGCNQVKLCAECAEEAADSFIEAGGVDPDTEMFRAAIRKHRDYRGDHRCWMDDEELYKVLPEGYTPPARDSAVEIKNCERFISCRQNPATVYVSPETRIEELERALKVAYRDITGDYADGAAWMDKRSVIQTVLDALPKPATS